MARSPLLSTRVLLICAAIGAVTGVLGGVEGWLAGPINATLPWLYAVAVGVHVLPGIIAQQLLRRPMVGLIAHLFAALIGAVIAPPYVMAFLGTAALFGGIQEGVAAIFRYRAWGWPKFLVSGVIISALMGAVMWVAHNVSTQSPAGQVLHIAAAIVGPIGWTFVGVAIGSALRRSGISAPRARA
ncbi:MAG: ECF transporter S component [Microbacterium sp.]